MIAYHKLVKIGCLILQINNDFFIVDILKLKYGEQKINRANQQVIEACNQKMRDMAKNQKSSQKEKNDQPSSA